MNSCLRWVLQRVHVQPQRRSVVCAQEREARSGGRRRCRQVAQRGLATRQCVVARVHAPQHYYVVPCLAERLE